MPPPAGSELRTTQQFQPIFRELGIDADLVFDHPLIVPWRKLEDRENCTLDAVLEGGGKIRWHVKRYPASQSNHAPVDDEVRGHLALCEQGIPTAVMVAHGKLCSGKNFVIFEDLDGYLPADKLIESGVPFDQILFPTADLASRLHARNLHHRDLYLCHFMIKIDHGKADVRLIDSARVKQLPGFFTRNRWIVKDLAQFWYSTLSQPISDEQRTAWLKRYGEQRGLASMAPFRRRIERKVEWIARHDKQLRKQQPSRNVSIPTPQPVTKAQG